MYCRMTKEQTMQNRPREPEPALTASRIVALPVEDLIRALDRQCRLSPPKQLSSPEDLDKAARLMSRCTSLYAYLTEMALYMENRKRQLKASGAAKGEIEEALMKQKILTSFAEFAHQTSAVTSRMASLKTMAQQELTMGRDPTWTKKPEHVS